MYSAATESVKDVISSAVYPVHWMKLVICCEMAQKRMEMSRVSVRKIKALIEGGDSDTDW
jgi:hypothetical protein